jgi:hypothetical protein
VKPQPLAQRLQHREDREKGGILAAGGEMCGQHVEQNATNGARQEAVGEQSAEVSGTYAGA